VILAASFDGDAFRVTLAVPLDGAPRLPPRACHGRATAGDGAFV